jgi:hypothetical protein
MYAPLMSSRARSVSVVSFVVVALTVTGCVVGSPAQPQYTQLTPQDLEQRGTRGFPNVSIEGAVAATASALSTLGYVVTLKSANPGLVKTAPRQVSTSATGGRYNAQLITDELSWSIEVFSDQGMTWLRATPHAFRNGAEMGGTAFVAEVLDPRFNDLWRELTETMSMRPTTQAVEPQPI